MSPTLDSAMTHELDMRDLPDEAATERLGEQFAATLRPGDFVALDGDLGAGKTTFVRGVARGLGIDPERVSSPTFVNMQSYPYAGGSLVHVDAWRIENLQLLESLGWDELLAARDTIVIVEWASRIEVALPAARLHIRLSFGAQNAGRRAEVIDSRVSSSARPG